MCCRVQGESLAACFPGLIHFWRWSSQLTRHDKSEKQSQPTNSVLHPQILWSSYSPGSLLMQFPALVYLICMQVSKLNFPVAVGCSQPTPCITTTTLRQYLDAHSKGFKTGGELNANWRMRWLTAGDRSVGGNIKSTTRNSKHAVSKQMQETQLSLKL